MWSHFYYVILNIFLPSMTFMIVISTFCICLASIVSKPTVKGWQLLIVSFCLLGGVIGIFVGNSLTPVIGTVLPAVLTFITGLLAYLFGKDNLEEWRPVIPNCIISLLLSVLIGSFMGAQIRLDYEESEKEYERWILHYKNVSLPVAKEGYLKILKKEELEPVDFDPMVQRQLKKESNQ